MCARLRVSRDCRRHAAVVASSGMEEGGPPTWLIGRAAETAYRLSDSGDPITPKDVAECMPLTVGAADLADRWALEMAAAVALGVDQWPSET